MYIHSLAPISESNPCKLPVKTVAIPCGFPSPAEDFKEAALDLNTHIVSHPSATYFARAEGESLSGLGIHHGDLLVVNRALKPRDGEVVIAAINGELACKILDIKAKQFVSANPDFPAVPIGDDMNIEIEGVVTHAVHYLNK